MRIDRTHRNWLIASLAILGIATAAYVAYARSAPRGPNGGSALGLTFGIAGSACMVFAGLLGARKKVPVWRIGRAQAWMRGHLWLGLLSLPLILYHAGFHFGGTLTSVLLWLLVIVVVSGIFGAVLQHYLPSVMTAEVNLETIYEEIDAVRAQLGEEAENLVMAACGRGRSANLSLDAVAASGRQARAPVALAELSEEQSKPLVSFYRRQMRPFLEEPNRSAYPLADAGRAAALFEQLRTLLPPSLHGTVEDLEDICEEVRQLRRQSRLHHWLHGWLLLHIPLSLALLLLGAVHAVMALRY